MLVNAVGVKITLFAEPVFWIVLGFWCCIDSCVRLFWLLPRYEYFKEKFAGQTKTAFQLWWFFGFFSHVPLSSEEKWRKRIYIYVGADVLFIIIAALAIILLWAV